MLQGGQNVRIVLFLPKIVRNVQIMSQIVRNVQKISQIVRNVEKMSQIGRIFKIVSPKKKTFLKLSLNSHFYWEHCRLSSGNKVQKISHKKHPNLKS